MLNMNRSRMTADELSKKMYQHDLTKTKLCDAIFNKTGAIIAPKHIDKALTDHGRLSEPMTGLLRMFFCYMEQIAIDG